MPCPSLRFLAVMLALAAWLPLSGCQIGPRTVTEDRYLPRGDWAVVDIRPGPSGVRDTDEAMAAYGQVLHFEPGLARSGGQTCAGPRYLASLMVGDRYLHRELGLRAADLGLYARQDVRITEVFCDGKRWTALGGVVLWIDEERAYAVRGRTLYELRRLGTPG